MNYQERDRLGAAAGISIILHILLFAAVGLLYQGPQLPEKNTFGSVRVSLAGSPAEETAPPSKPAPVAEPSSPSAEALADQGKPLPQGDVGDQGSPVAQGEIIDQGEPVSQGEAAADDPSSGAAVQPGTSRGSVSPSSQPQRTEQEGSAGQDAAGGTTTPSQSVPTGSAGGRGDSSAAAAVDDAPGVTDSAEEEESNPFSDFVSDALGEGGSGASAEEAESASSEGGAESPAAQEPSPSEEGSPLVWEDGETHRSRIQTESPGLEEFQKICREEDLIPYSGVVSFTVDENGRVLNNPLSVTPRPESPAAERALLEAFEAWFFKPEPGAGEIRGRFRILLTRG